MNKLAQFLFAVTLTLCSNTNPGRCADPPAPNVSPSGSGNPAFAVTVTGKGAPMILIPGLTCSGEVWDSTVAHYKDRYQCHVLTLAGFAGQPPIKPPMLETVRKELAAYIRAKGLNHPVIVGHSLGGFLAFSLASSEPKLVGPIVAVDGLPFFAALMDPAATEQSARAMAEGFRSGMAASKREDFLAQNRQMMAGMVTDPAKLELISGWAAKCDIPSVAEAMGDMVSTDLRQKISAIQTPVLLIGAAGFATAPEALSGARAAYEAQVAKIPNHKVVMAEHAKHFVMYDDPKFLFQAMDEFLKP
jgi:pimeloyl-ACP methyl ester carboxylesterase